MVLRGSVLVQPLKDTESNTACGSRQGRPPSSYLIRKLSAHEMVDEQVLKAVTGCHGSLNHARMTAILPLVYCLTASGCCRCGSGGFQLAIIPALPPSSWIFHEVIEISWPKAAFLTVSHVASRYWTLLSVWFRPADSGASQRLGRLTCTGTLIHDQTASTNLQSLEAISGMYASLALQTLLI